MIVQVLFIALSIASQSLIHATILKIPINGKHNDVSKALSAEDVFNMFFEGESPDYLMKMTIPKSEYDPSLVEPDFISQIIDLFENVEPESSIPFIPNEDYFRKRDESSETLSRNSKKALKDLLNLFLDDDPTSNEPVEVFHTKPLVNVIAKDNTKRKTKSELSSGNKFETTVDYSNGNYEEPSFKFHSNPFENIIGKDDIKNKYTVNMPSKKLSEKGIDFFGLPSKIPTDTFSTKPLIKVTEKDNTKSKSRLKNPPRISFMKVFGSAGLNSEELMDVFHTKPLVKVISEDNTKKEYKLQRSIGKDFANIFDSLFKLIIKEKDKIEKREQTASEKDLGAFIDSSSSYSKEPTGLFLTKVSMKVSVKDNTKKENIKKMLSKKDRETSTDSEDLDLEKPTGLFYTWPMFKEVLESMIQDDHKKPSFGDSFSNKKLKKINKKRFQVPSEKDINQFFDFDIPLSKEFIDAFEPKISKERILKNNIKKEHKLQKRSISYSGSSIDSSSSYSEEPIAIFYTKPLDKVAEDTKKIEPSSGIQSEKDVDESIDSESSFSKKPIGSYHSIPLLKIIVGDNTKTEQSSDMQLRKKFDSSNGPSTNEPMEVFHIKPMVKVIEDMKKIEHRSVMQSEKDVDESIESASSFSEKPISSYHSIPLLKIIVGDNTKPEQSSDIQLRKKFDSSNGPSTNEPMEVFHIKPMVKVIEDIKKIEHRSVMQSEKDVDEAIDSVSSFSEKPIGSYHSIPLLKIIVGDNTKTEQSSEIQSRKKFDSSNGPDTNEPMEVFHIKPLVKVIEEDNTKSKYGSEVFHIKPLVKVIEEDNTKSQYGSETKSLKELERYIRSMGEDSNKPIGFFHSKPLIKVIEDDKRNSELGLKVALKEDSNTFVGSEGSTPMEPIGVLYTQTIG